MQRRISYIEKLPNKRTIANGGITAGKIGAAAVTRNNVTFGVVKPLSEKPAIGAATPEDYDNVYYNSGTGALTGIDQNGDEFQFADPDAQSTADGAAGAAAAAQSSASTALTAANGKNKVFHQPDIPTNAQLTGVTLAADDIWFQTGETYGNRPNRYVAQKNVTFKQLSSGIATLTTSATHGFEAKDWVYITGVGSPFDGTYEIDSVPTTTSFTYKKTGTNLSQTAASGTVDGWRPYGYSSLAVTSIDASVITSGILRGRTLELNGGQINYATKTVTKKSYFWGLATLTTDVAHGLEIGQSIIVSGIGAPFDGSFVISGYEGPYGTWITYKLPDASSYEWLPETATSGSVQVALLPSTFSMTVSPSLDVAMYPITDFDANDNIYSPGMSVSQDYSGGFNNIDTDEFHLVTGAFGSHTPGSISSFGGVFGVSTGGASPTDEVGAGLVAFVDSAQLWDGSRAAVVAKIYGDIVQISTMSTSTDITISGTNIDSTGSYGDHKTVMNYGSGFLEGQGGIQKGTIAWTDATVSAATLSGGKAGDLVFKFD